MKSKLEWCKNKAQKGLIEVKPNSLKAQEHVKKAEHNLRCMIYLTKGNFSDWAVSASFYAMYHCLLAILVKEGYESKNQECTFVVIDHLIDQKKIDLNLSFVKRIANSLGRDETIVKLREEFQYETKTSFDMIKLKQLETETKEFIDIVKEILKE